MWKLVKDKYIYVITFLIALAMIIGAWIVGDVGPFGGKCMVVVDGVHQYLPFFSEYQEKLKHLSDFQYTFDVGMGNNFVSLWSYYLSSPFNLIILLFAKKNLPMALNIIISSKIIMAAMCFAYFLMHAGNPRNFSAGIYKNPKTPADDREENENGTIEGKVDIEKKLKSQAGEREENSSLQDPRKNPGVIVFSLFYAFSSFVVGYYWNLMWLDCIFIFPIIILGMEKMMIKKDSRMYVLALFYSFVCNYYISFMICMFLVLCFFVFRFKSVDDFFMKGIRFAVASIISAAMGAVVLLPAYKGIMTTASAKFALPEWEFYGSFADTLRSHLFCSEVLTNQVGDAGTNLYCGVFTILLAFMFFFIRDIAFSKKIKYALLLVMFVVSFNNVKLNYIWHGFHNQYGIPNRFAFLYVFILLLMAYEVFLKRDSIRLYMVVLAYTLSMLFVIFTYFNADTVYENHTYQLTALLLTVYLIFFGLFVFLQSTRQVMMYILCFVAVVEMGVNGLYGFYQDGSSEPEYYYGETEAVAALRARNEKQGEFTRADVIKPLFVDEATWHNLRSVGIFGSTVRGEMVDIMGDLGFYTGANEYLYYGATPFTNALFGVKYAYARSGDFVYVDMNPIDSEDSDDDTVTLYENDNILPIGYMVNDETLDFETGNNGPFTVQNELSGAMTGIEPVFSSIFEDMDVTAYGTNVDVTLVDDNNADYENASDSARVDMIYTVPEDMDLYMSCRGTNVHKIALLIDGTEVGYDRFQSQILHVGKMKKGQLVDIQFDFNDKDEDEDSGDVYCYPMKFLDDEFSAFYNKMLNRSMKMTSFNSTKIMGTVNVSDGEVFMTSIPYDEGWEIYCDGEKVETTILVDAFLGAELPVGEHELKLVYHSPGLRQGLIVSLIGIALFAVLIYGESLGRRNSVKVRT